MLYLNSVVKVPPVDVLEVKKAIYYARKYHGSQMRQSGEPFYSDERILELPMTNIRITHF